MPSAWITHVKAVYAKGKKKNAAYKYGQAMKDAKATYKKGGAAKTSTAEPEAAAPKKRRARKKKKVSEEETGGGRRRGVKKQHTAGLGNVEEGRLAEKIAPVKVKRRKRKRPLLSKNYSNIN